MADHVVMAAAKMVLEPSFEADFLPSSYGFRPGLSAHHALETVRQAYLDEAPVGDPFVRVIAGFNVGILAGTLGQAVRGC